MKKRYSLHSKEHEKEVDSLVDLIKDVEQISPLDISVSWENVLLYSRKINRTKKKILFYSLSGVASFLVLVGVFVFQQREGKQSEDLLSVNLLEMPVDTSLHNEVVLLDKDETIKLKDDASVVYGKDGNVYVADENLSGKIIGVNREEESSEKIGQLIVPKGKKASLTFSDGTKLHVNSGSRVIYPQTFAKQKREIVVEGEAFIDVARDEKRPFIVKTPAMEIVVLGTQFNVSAYKEAANTSVVLVKGSVGVKIDKTSDYEVIQPNQLIMHDGHNTQVTDVDVYEYISWIDNVMLLNQRPVGEVLDRLSYSYGRTIYYSPEIKNIPISGKLDLKEDLRESIRIICLSLALNYQEDESNNIVLTLKKGCLCEKPV